MFLRDQLLHVFSESLQENCTFFSGNCPSEPCNLHPPDKRSLHDWDCRIVARRELVGPKNAALFSLDGIKIETGDGRKLVWDEMRLQKSLFSVPPLTVNASTSFFSAAIHGVVPRWSHRVRVSKVVALYARAFGLTLVPIGKIDDREFLWPRRPGLFTFLAIFDIFDSIRSIDAAHHSDPTVTLSIDESTSANCFTVTFTFALRSAIGAAELKKVIQDRNTAGLLGRAIDEIRHFKPSRCLRPPAKAANSIIDSLNDGECNDVVELKVEDQSLLISWVFTSSTDA